MWSTFSFSTLQRLSLLIVLLLFAAGARAQTPAQPSQPTNFAVATTSATNRKEAAPVKPETTEARISALEQMLLEQNQRLDQLQQTIAAQQETIRNLAARLNPAERTTAAIAPDAVPTQTAATTGVDDRLKNVETKVAALGSIKFSGDIRLRSESFFGQSNSLANGSNPAVLGNDLSPRHRMRLRARLQMRGSIGPEFDWGIRVATGSFADNISTNQTMTDFFTRKPFALDQAFITYKPKAVPGLKLQGGKFEPPWTFTEMTIDNDLMVEGFNQSYTRAFKETSSWKELTFVAWELPLLERNSAFVRNANGTVNVSESRRGGRDLAMFGGQIRARIEPNSKVGLSLAVADLFYSGTQFISPVQFFGSQIQLPLTFTIPANGAAPAQTITTQVSIPRELLVAGNANLGLSNASNNATNRDGRLASGFNLVDVLGRLDLKYSKRFPVSVILDVVTNTQVHDVVTAGPGGVDVLLPNRENNGFWGEVQAGKTKDKGDVQFGYTFMRVEKDAVLTPFNISDVSQQSDMRTHRMQFSYTADPRVVFTVTGTVTQRPNGLLGPFVATPPGSSNRAVVRLQIDTVLRF